MLNIKNYSGKNLRNLSFKGQNLEGADFSYSNISGSDFTHANLKKANFSHSKTGIKQSWLLTVTFFLLFLVSLGTLFLSYLGAFLGSILPTPETIAGLLLTIIFSLTTFIGFISITILKGIGKELGLFGLIIVTFVAICLIWPGVNNSRGNVILLAVVMAVYIAGVSVGTIAVAIARIMPKTLMTKVMILIAFLLGFLGIYFGVQGIEKTSELIIALIIAIPVTFSLIGLSFYIGWQAITGNKKYKSIQKIAIFIFSKGGTSFRGSNLTDTNFTEANLKYTDFRNATLTRTCWLNVRQLDLARVNKTYLEDSDISKLVVNKYADKGNFNNIKCNLNLENARLENVSLTSADLGEANLKGVTCLNVNFDDANLHNANLEDAKLQDASFIGADLSEANLQNVDLSGAKLVRTQLYEADLTGANLTGAFIQDWGVSEKTKLAQIKCEEIFMQLPTKENKYDPCRKPDETDEYFQEGDFIDFITPLRDTLKNYHEKYFDPRQQVRILDLPHRGGIDSLAAAISLKELTDHYPQAGIEVVALQGGRDKNIRLQIKVNKEVNRSQISIEYKQKYREIHSLPNQERQYLLANVNKETNDCIRILGNIIDTVTSSKQIYLETDINFLGKKKILFLAANPQHQDEHRLQVENREIQEGLKRAKRGEQFDFIQKWAVSLDDLRRYLLDENPQIVHFSGYGVSDEGLAFENEDRQTQSVDPLTLANLFELFKDQVECLLLNACYSESQAEAISEHIDYVIGINQEISDRAAIKFAVGFYDALGAGRSIEQAFKFGCIAIDLDNLPESLKPVLKRKEEKSSEI